jgi:hypothetical protein
MVSRKHAEFRLGEGHVTVLDANSRLARSSMVSKSARR